MSEYIDEILYSSRDLIWDTLDEKYVLKSPWINVRMDHIKMPSGVEIIDFYVSELPDWVNVIAITVDQQYVIEEQYRHGIKRVCFELPAGNINSGEEPLNAARRELLEETGFSGGEWSYLGSFVPNASGANNVCHSFLALNVEKSDEQQQETTEEIKVHLMCEKEVRAILNKGLMPEGVMAAPLWQYLANK